MRTEAGKGLSVEKQNDILRAQRTEWMKKWHMKTEKEAHERDGKLDGFGNSAWGKGLHFRGYWVGLMFVHLLPHKLFF